MKEQVGGPAEQNRQNKEKQGTRQTDDGVALRVSGLGWVACFNLGSGEVMVNCSWVPKLVRDCE